MLSRIVIFVLIVGLVYLNYTTPKIDEHKAFLLEELEQTFPIPEEMQEKLWREVDYSNFMVCSFMKKTEGSTMITSGFMNKIKMVDNDWIDEIKIKLQQQEESYY